MGNAIAPDPIDGRSMGQVIVRSGYQFRIVDLPIRKVLLHRTHPFVYTGFAGVDLLPAAYKLYPKVFVEALERFKKFGDVSRIPTKNFFFGMEPMEETMVNIGSGKTIIVQLLSIGQVNEEGLRTVFFKVNGQTRNVQIEDRSVEGSKVKNKKKDPEELLEVGSPLQGALSNVLVKRGQEVKKSEALFVIEAMKMETTVTSPADGKVKELVLKNGSLVDADDLIVILTN